MADSTGCLNISLDSALWTKSYDDLRFSDEFTQRNGKKLGGLFV